MTSLNESQDAFDPLSQDKPSILHLLYDALNIPLFRLPRLTAGHYFHINLHINILNVYKPFDEWVY